MSYNQNTQTMTRYFDLHVFHDRKNGFSVPIKMDNVTEGLIWDEQVIEHALQKKLIDTEDAQSVDYVDEISEDTFKQMSNI